MISVFMNTFYVYGRDERSELCRRNSHVLNLVIESFTVQFFECREIKQARVSNVFLQRTPGP